MSNTVGNQSDEFEEEEALDDSEKVQKDQSWLQHFLLDRFAPYLQRIEQELEVLKNKKPKTNSKKHKDKSNLTA